MSDGGPAIPPQKPAAKAADRIRQAPPWLWFAAFVLTMALVIGGGFLWPRYQRAKLGHELLAMKIDDLPRNANLSAFAIKLGEPVYVKHCAQCHGAELEGDPVEGAPRLSDADWLYGRGLLSDIETTILYGVRSGHPKGRNLAIMPAFANADPHSVDRRTTWPHLSDPEIDDLTAYVLVLSGRPADPAAATRGGALFSGKGACHDCHGAGGAGDVVLGAPDLTDRAWLYGAGAPAEIRESIAAGRRGDCPAWIDALGALKVRAVAAYVKSRSQQDARPPGARR